MITKISNNNYIQAQSLKQNFRHSSNVSFVGLKDFTKNEKKFYYYKINLSRIQHQSDNEMNLARWNFYTNSTNKNYKEMQASEQTWTGPSETQLLKDLHTFKRNGIRDPLAKKAFGRLMALYNTTNVKIEELYDIANNLENHISQKFNAYRGEINGKKYSNVALNQILETEKDPQILKKAYFALNITNGNLIAKDLQNLVVQRNRFAKAKGFDSFFDYKLKKDFNIDKKELFKVLDILDKKTEEPYKKIYKEWENNITKDWGITPEEIKPWHYALESENSIDTNLASYVEGKDIKKISKSIYEDMGFDISNVKLDLYPRKNKNQHGFCFDIDTNKDIRILATLQNDLASLKSLNHELGHAMYDKGISDKIPYENRQVSSSAMTEAIAVMMSSITEKENVLSEKLGVPTEIVNKAKNDSKVNEIEYLRNGLAYTNFENEMYKDPTQDLGKLWNNMILKYTFKKNPLSCKNNWASIPHFLTHPAYLQNYLRAHIMASQIYDAAVKELGPLTKSKETAKFFKNNLFRFGSMITENQGLIKMTGKSFSVEPLLKQLNLIK